MARYQDLPNRTDTITVPIDDATMCYNYGIAFTCTALSVLGKSQLNVNTSCSWTVPSGVTSIFIEAWGGGSGGTGVCQCCCCQSGMPGSSGGYVAATIPVVPGCVYTICAGSGGSYGDGCQSGAGNPSYVTGAGLNNFCAAGGAQACSGCNAPFACFGNNMKSQSYGYFGSTTYSNNVLVVCGEGGHYFGCNSGCGNNAKGGSAPFNGGIGAWTTYDSCCPNGCRSPAGGGFPGGGGGGAPQMCECSYCVCGSCGGRGLVRIWY